MLYELDIFLSSNIAEFFGLFYWDVFRYQDSSIYNECISIQIIVQKYWNICSYIDYCQRIERFAHKNILLEFCFILCVQMKEMFL